MKITSARQGRVFVIRLENGDVVHECLEAAARREGITHAVCFLLGGADAASRLVVGPADGQARQIVPTVITLDNVFEVAGVGTIFPDENGRPVLHLHAACGRGESARVGCVREGVVTWLVGEVVLLELLDCAATRRRDPTTGFELLDC